MTQAAEGNASKSSDKPWAICKPVLPTAQVACVALLSLLQVLSSPTFVVAGEARAHNSYILLCADSHGKAALGMLLCRYSSSPDQIA
jgi:hypothetical protein